MDFYDKLAKLGFDNYDLYLSSNHWNNFKKYYRESNKLKCCIVCLAPHYVLHHLTYKRLGAERLNDVMPLCHKCHSDVHAIHKEKFIKLNDIEKIIKLSKHPSKKAVLKRMFEHRRKDKSVAPLQKIKPVYVRQPYMNSFEQLIYNLLDKGYYIDDISEHLNISSNRIKTFMYNFGLPTPAP